MGPRGSSLVLRGPRRVKGVKWGQVRSSEVKFVKGVQVGLRLKEVE